MRFGRPEYDDRELSFEEKKRRAEAAAARLVKRNQSPIQPTVWDNQPDAPEEVYYEQSNIEFQGAAPEIERMYELRRARAIKKREEEIRAAEYNAAYYAQHPRPGYSRVEEEVEREPRYYQKGPFGDPYDLEPQGSTGIFFSQVVSAVLSPFRLAYEAAEWTLWAAKETLKIAAYTGSVALIAYAVVGTAITAQEYNGAQYSPEVSALAHKVGDPIFNAYLTGKAIASSLSNPPRQTIEVAK